MGKDRYDVIVIGARCAGSPTAMLLANRGYRVLVVDRATFPSDTISTHLIHPPGVAALRRWGLLDRLIATGCPPVDTYTFDFGAITIAGSPSMAVRERDPVTGETGEIRVAYAPRRTRLDKLLVDAAARAGAEIREGFTVDEVVLEDGRVTGVRGRTGGAVPVVERAQVVVGADGWRSLLAHTVRAEFYRERPKLLAAYYAYWSGLPTGGRFETYIRPERGFAVTPTNDGLTLVIAPWPYRQFEANKADIEGNYLRTLALAPPFAERLAGAARQHRLEPPSPDLVRLVSAIHGNQPAMDDFVRVNAGVLSPAEFFAPDNVARLVAA